MPPPTSLTLIVAATRTLGVGYRGALPWPPIKQEMAYFTRVTKRCRSCPEGSKSRHTNAVIMGRKTWESIPERFRPLKDRVNVVISRKQDALGFGRGPEGVSSKGEEVGEETALVVPSLEVAISTLQSRYPPCSSLSSNSPIRLDSLFIIGGAQIYAQALKLSSCKRILLTRIKKEYECDTFLPELEILGRKGSGWTLKGEQERDDWIGEKLGEKENGGEEWEVEMWERNSVN